MKFITSAEMGKSTHQTRNTASKFLNVNSVIPVAHFMARGGPIYLYDIADVAAVIDRTSLTLHEPLCSHDGEFIFGVPLRSSGKTPADARKRRMKELTEQAAREIVTKMVKEFPELMKKNVF